MPRMPLPPRARCPHQPPSAPRSHWPHPRTSPRSSCREKGLVSDTRTRGELGALESSRSHPGMWDSPCVWEGMGCKIELGKPPAHKKFLVSTCPLYPSCISGMGVLLELLQAAHQLSLLVRRHAGKNGCSDEDLQGGDGSVLAPHPTGQHPACGSLQVG